MPSWRRSLEVRPDSRCLEDRQKPSRARLATLSGSHATVAPRMHQTPAGSLRLQVAWANHCHLQKSQPGSPPPMVSEQHRPRSPLPRQTLHRESVPHQPFPSTRMHLKRWPTHQRTEYCPPSKTMPTPTQCLNQSQQNPLTRRSCPVTRQLLPSATLRIDQRKARDDQGRRRRWRMLSGATRLDPLRPPFQLKVRPSTRKARTEFQLRLQARRSRPQRSV